MNINLNLIKANFQICIDPKPLSQAVPGSIFIGGSARSGTTLLQNILCTSKETNPLIPESAPFRFLAESYINIKRHTHKFPRIYFSDEDINAFFQTIYINLIQKICSHFSCKKAILKEPAMTPWFPVIYKFLSEEARFVCLIRDPRDVAVSMLQWGRKAKEKGEHHWSQERDMTLFSDFYTSFYTFLTHEQSQFFKNVLMLKYEDLVSDIHKHLQIIEQFTGIDLACFNPSEKWLPGKVDLSSEGILGNAFSNLFGKPVSKDNIGKFKQDLSKEEIKVIEQNCPIAFDLFQYPRMYPEKKANASKPVLFPKLAPKGKNRTYQVDSFKNILLNRELNKLRYKSKQYDAIAKNLSNLKHKAVQYDSIIEELPSLKSKAKQYDHIVQDLPSLKSKAKLYDRIKKELPSLRYKAKQFDSLRQKK